jgi:hypothetical protein
VSPGAVVDTRARQHANRRSRESWDPAPKSMIP